MVNQTEPELDVMEEDFEFQVTDSAAQAEEELIPEGRYALALVSANAEDKPEWKIESSRRRYPDKEPKTKQVRWVFELVEEGYKGRRVTDWQDLSWHVKSNNAKYLAALLGKSKLTGTECGTIKPLVGRMISGRINVFNGRNYIDPNGCEPITPRSMKADKLTVEVQGSPFILLGRLNKAIEDSHMTGGELVVQWSNLGLAGITRDQLSPSQMDTTIAHFEKIAAGLAPVESLPF